MQHSVQLFKKKNEKKKKQTYKCTAYCSQEENMFWRAPVVLPADAADAADAGFCAVSVCCDVAVGFGFGAGATVAVSFGAGAGVAVAELAFAFV